jgi:hypothetical protein
MTEGALASGGPAAADTTIHAIISHMKGCLHTTSQGQCFSPCGSHLYRAPETFAEDSPDGGQPVRGPTAAVMFPGGTRVMHGFPHRCVCGRPHLYGRYTLYVWRVLQRLGVCGGTPPCTSRLHTCCVCTTHLTGASSRQSYGAAAEIWACERPFIFPVRYTCVLSVCCESHEQSPPIIITHMFSMRTRLVWSEFPLWFA